MLTDEEVAEVQRNFAALPFEDPNFVSSRKCAEGEGYKAIDDDMKAVYEMRTQQVADGAVWMRTTIEDGTIWVEGWRTRPEKPAPFRALVTYADG